MTREELREEWERRIADFKASGMTRVQWCKEHGESIYKLKYWLYKIQRTFNPKCSDKVLMETSRSLLSISLSSS